MLIFDEAAINHLDQSICQLESMGTMLTHLATMETQKPDLTSLADLGRMIKQHAGTALEILSEGEELRQIDAVEVIPEKEDIPVEVADTPSKSPRIGFV